MIALKIIAAFLIALFLSAFQYLYKTKSRGLFALRFLIYFVLLLLLANLNFKAYKQKNIKPDLFVLVDQSHSIKALKADSLVTKILDTFKNSGLDKKYNLHFYGFGENLNPLENIHFTEQNSRISWALNQLNALYDKKYKAPLILITDGNSITESTGFNVNSSFQSLNVFPVIVGDTTHYDNLAIEEINTNPVAFKGNKFPVEIMINYTGNKKIFTRLKIWHHKHVVSTQKISFKKPATKIIKLYLFANQVGNQLYKAEVEAFKKEKNTKDNIQYFSNEVITQQKKIAIIASIIHPDLGLIKRQLAKNKYIKTDFFIIKKLPSTLSNYTTLILYQPTEAFSKLFKKKSLSETNWFMITGPHTDWKWINKQNLFFKKNVTSLKENYFPVKNPDFTLFDFPDLSFEKYPPLTDNYGKISSNNLEIAVYAKINNIPTHQGLLIFNKHKKQAALLGENYWQWGVYASKVKESEQLTDFMQQIIQYVSVNKDITPLKVYYNPLYSEGDLIEIKARILDKNLSPDLKDKPIIKVFDKNKHKVFEAPLLLHKDFYSIKLDQLAPGKYSFSVYSKNRNQNFKGSFSIKPINKEELFINANKEFLKNIADNTNGKIFTPSQTTRLISLLKDKNNYPVHFESSKKNIFLIEFKYGLFLLIFLLAVEWFIKKLRGRI